MIYIFAAFILWAAVAALSYGIDFAVRKEKASSYDTHISYVLVIGFFVLLPLAAGDFLWFGFLAVVLTLFLLYKLWQRIQYNAWKEHKRLGLNVPAQPPGRRKLEQVKRDLTFEGDKEE